jgi:hypothetical protein
MSATNLVYGTVGANMTITMAKNSTTMSVSGLTGQLCVNDSVTGTNPVSKITAVPGGGSCSTSNGNYTVADPASKALSTAATTNSTTLYVMANTQSHGTLSAAQAQTNGGNVNISSGPVGGNYTLSAATNSAGPQFFAQGNSSIIYVPNGASLPSVGTQLAVYSGTGAFTGLAKVVAGAGANWYTIDQTPTTALFNATVCGGTCAMFNNPSSTASQTTFTVTNTGGTSDWAGGFVCLSGVDASRIVPLSSTNGKTSRWQEINQ